MYHSKSGRRNNQKRKVGRKGKITTKNNNKEQQQKGRLSLYIGFQERFSLFSDGAFSWNFLLVEYTFISKYQCNGNFSWSLYVAYTFRAAATLLCSSSMYPPSNCHPGLAYHCHQEEKNGTCIVVWVMMKWNTIQSAFFIFHYCFVFSPVWCKWKRNNAGR